MYRIRKGEILTITGQNIYSGGDTSVYFNSITSASQLEIIPSGYNEENTQVQVRVPGGLPDINYSILYNGVNYTTGTLPYHFVGAPQIHSLSKNTEYWRRSVIIKGKHLEDTTGIYLGDFQVTEYDWPSNNKIVFKVPVDSTTGYVKVYTTLGNTQYTGLFYPIAPPIWGKLSSQNAYQYGDTVEVIEGDSLDKVNRIVLSGLSSNGDGDIFVTDLTSYGSTGKSFVLPEGIADQSYVKIQHESGYYQNGEFIPNVLEEAVLADPLTVSSTYIHSINKAAESYNQPLELSGVNLNKSKILFGGYGNTMIGSSPISSGHHTLTVNVPKNIVEGSIIASGHEGNSAGIVYTGLQEFRPIPTIENISTHEWTMGSTIEFDAINASRIFETVGITGFNKLATSESISFVSNPAESTDNINHFGSVIIDNSQLDVNPVTGYTKVTAVINSNMIGQGSPFLVAESESKNANSITELRANLSDSITYENINNITGHPVSIARKIPAAVGVDKPETLRTGVLTISGNYFLGVTGLSLVGGNETKYIARSGFLDQVNNAQEISKIGIIYTGYGLNTYEQLHQIQVNVEDFNFTGTVGTLEFL